MFKKVEPRVNLPEVEEKVLRFWQQNKIFEKSVSERPKEKTFSFYDGPPYATGTPHYGHILAGTIKDVIPRFKTMQGYRVERVWGWDTHGLPIENIVEQELDIKTKLQIREMGIDKFNEKCKEKVLEYAHEWEKIVERTGRWVDIKNAYISMDPKYMESVWWVFKSLWEKDLIYMGHKVMPYCPRCATGLSSFEVGLGGYKDKTDKTLTVKFELEGEADTYLLAWTTTPWTLPGNLALTVNPNIDYVKVLVDGKNYILAKDRLEYYKKELGEDVGAEFKGKELVGKSYKPVFSYYKNPQNAFKVIPGDFVTTVEGTGIVHTAPAFGEDDYRVAKENGIDFYMPVNDLGEFEVEVPEYAGKAVIHAETNAQIAKDLGDKVLREEEYSHSYPYCWRCDTPLIYKALDSWFVKTEKIREKMLENNKGIHWVPKFIGSGRYAKLVEGAPDWNISRNRFWGTPIPVWKCEKCKAEQVFGSIAQLEEATGTKIEDIHLHKIEGLKVACKCGGESKITGEVLDVWFDSGSMPYGSIHYPFENKEKFERDFPADFIAEGIDQTRGWFNSLLSLGTALFGKSPYQNVVVNGIVLAEDGQKMSKRLKNYPDPSAIMDKYGADAMRFYMMSSPAVRAGDLNFSEKGVDEVVKKLILTLWNSYSFFMTYASLDGFVPRGETTSGNILDRWLLSKTNGLVVEVTKELEKYELSKAAGHLWEFVDELSNWYIRRSRKRFWKSENDADKNQAYETLYYSLNTYIKLLAPFMPFITEEINSGLNPEGESIHLAEWPTAEKKAIDKKVEAEMDAVRKVVELGLSERNEKGIKVRQPLASITVKSPEVLSDDAKKIVAEEVNVKEVLAKKGEVSAKLDTVITPELRDEGIARDFVRSIQEARKKAGFNVEDRIITGWETVDADVASAIKSQEDYIARETLSETFGEGVPKSQYKETVKINGQEVKLGISKK